MSYFVWPPPDRSDELEYCYWNGDLEEDRDEERDRKQKSVPQENKTDDEGPF